MRRRRTPTSRSRSCAAWATTSRPRWPPTGCACAPTARSATSWPGWPTSSAGCWRTPRNESFLADQASRAPARRAAGRAMSTRRTRCRRFATSRCSSCAARPCARRSPARWARSTRGCRCACRCWIGDERREADELVSTDPGDAGARRRRGGPRRAPPSRRRGGRGAAGVRRPGRATPAAERAALLVARRGLDARAPRASSRRSRSASAPSRGPRPTPTSARRSTSSSTTRAGPSRSSEGRAALPGAGRAQRDALRRRAASSPSIAPWNFPLAIPCGMVAAALATGNPVVLKPAEQSPGCGLMVVAGAARAPACRPARSRCCPATARSARRSCATRDVRDDRLHRLRPGRAWRSCARRPRSRRASATSSASSPRWAARTASSSTADADLDEAVPAIVASRLRLRRPEVLAPPSRVLVHEAIADAAARAPRRRGRRAQVGRRRRVRHRRRRR